MWWLWFHQERGRHTIVHTNADDDTAARVEWSQGNNIGSCPSVRSAQHPGGFPVQSRPDNEYGVDDGHGASATRVCQVGRAAGRLWLWHSPTDDSSSSYRPIRTPGQSGRTPCQCPGTTFAFPPFKMVPQVLQKIAQSPGVRVFLIAPLQQAASWFPELMDLSQEDPIPLFVKGQDLLTGWPRLVTSGRQIYMRGRLVCDIHQQTTHKVCIAVSGPQGWVARCHVHALGKQEGPPVCVPAIQDSPSSSAEVEGQELLTFWWATGWGTLVTAGRQSTRMVTLRANLRAKGHSREAARMMSRSLRDSSLQVYESHWARFVAFCRSQKMARVSSQKSSFHHLYDAPLQRRTSPIDDNIT